MRFRYIGSCVDLEGEELDRHAVMRDENELVSYEEMLAHCPDLLDLADELGYERDPEEGLTLKDDNHVGFHKSKWGPRNVYYLSWSGFEFMWVQMPGLPLKEKRRPPNPSEMGWTR